MQGIYHTSTDVQYMYDSMFSKAEPFISSALFYNWIVGPRKRPKKTERSWLNLGVNLSLKGGRRRSRQPPTARARCAALSLVVPPWSKRLSPGCLEDGGCVFVTRNAMFRGVFNMIIRAPRISSIYAMYDRILACWLRCVMELAGYWGI